jgi:hypothetical protein
MEDISSTLNVFQGSSIIVSHWIKLNKLHKRLVNPTQTTLQPNQTVLIRQCNIYTYAHSLLQHQKPLHNPTPPLQHPPNNPLIPLVPLQLPLQPCKQLLRSQSLAPNQRDDLLLRNEVPLRDLIGVVGGCDGGGRGWRRGRGDGLTTGNEVDSYAFD